MKVGDWVWWRASVEGLYGYPAVCRIRVKILHLGTRVAKVRFCRRRSAEAVRRHVRVSELSGLNARAG